MDIKVLKGMYQPKHDQNHVLNISQIKELWEYQTKTVHDENSVTVTL